MNLLALAILMLSTVAVADEATCLSDFVYREARGEPTAGQLAVARVAQIRKERWGQSYCALLRTGHKVLRRGRDYATVRYVAEQVTKGAWSGFYATHFHSLRYTPHSWRKARYVGKLGHHRFFAR